MYIYIKKHYYILEGHNKVHYSCFPLSTYKAVLYKRSTVNPTFMKVTVFDPFLKSLQRWIIFQSIAVLALWSDYPHTFGGMTGELDLTVSS